jgi:hypothetical protein
MADGGESLIDRLKGALGMGDADHGDDHDDTRAERHMESGVPADRPVDDRGDTWGVDGAAQGTGREGVAGGTGASAAMGGAGASGPVGATPEPSLDEDAGGGAADARTVRTEYEMGHELDPDHETRAESGTLAQTRGAAATGRSPFEEDDERREPTGPTR